METPDSFIPLGHGFRDQYFNFAKGYTPLNHGSFGTFPTNVRDYQRKLQDLTEARPDTYLRYTYLKQLEESRRAIAPLLGASADEVVFIPNATTGINVVLRNLVYEEGDVILHFNTAYGACQKTIESLCETSPVERECIQLEYPAEDNTVTSRFRDTVLRLMAAGKNVKVAMFDTVITFPGARFPWEDLVRSCRDLGVLSLIDGAHGIGHIDLTSLGDIGPDFFTSNCYKWLFVPRGCAVLYVPFRNQHRIRTSFPTSWGFRPLADGPRENDPIYHTAFGELFKKVSTIDPTPYVCIPEALRFRERVCGGEARIRKYCVNLAARGGKRMAEILGTEVMTNSTGTLQQCCFVNVRLPLNVVPRRSSSAGKDDAAIHQTEQMKSDRAEDSAMYIREEDALRVAKWMTAISVKEYETMIPVKFYGGQIWCRISGQIYLEEGDFEWAADRLKEMCERVSKEYFRFGDEPDD